MLPFTPETPEQMRKRWPQALSFVYKIDSVANNGVRPGECRANTFDFADGRRFIVFVGENALDRSKELYASVSCHEESGTFGEIQDWIKSMGRKPTLPELLAWVAKWGGRCMDEFKQVAGEDAAGLTLQLITGQGVPNFTKPWNPAGSTLNDAGKV